MSNIENLQDFNNQKQNLVEISRGNSSSVHRYTSLTGEIIAVKIISIPNNQKQQQIEKKLKNETNFLKKYHHQNIVKTYFGFSYPSLTNREYILGMEYIERNLLSIIQNKIQTNTKFTDEEFFSYAIQLCDALYFLQQKDVAHSNVKPQNVLVTHDNTLKLCDFSGFKMDTEAYKSLIASEVVGTQSYLAPEINKDYQFNLIPIKCDAFSYGITMLQCYLCHQPVQMRKFNSQNGEAELEQLFIENKFQDEMKFLFRKCLVHDPIKRFDFLDIKIFLQSKLDNIALKNSKRFNTFQQDMLSYQRNIQDLSHQLQQSLEIIQNLSEERQQSQLIRNNMQQNIQQLITQVQSLTQNNNQLIERITKLERNNEQETSFYQNEIKQQNLQIQNANSKNSQLAQEPQNIQQEQSQIKSSSPKKRNQTLAKTKEAIIQKCQDNEETWEHLDQTYLKKAFGSNTKGLRIDNQTYNYYYDCYGSCCDYHWNDKTGTPQKDHTYWRYSYGKSYFVNEKDIPAAIKIVEELEKATGYEFGLCLRMLHSNLWDFQKSKNDLIN